jgi:hypothetical protein
MLDRAQPDFPPPRLSPSPQRPAAQFQNDPMIVRALLWLGIGIYLLCMGSWAWKTGLQIRDDAWTTTRTIRFEGDISNAISRWGTMVIQTSQDWANFNANKRRGPKDPQVHYVVRANPADPSERELGFFDLVHGVDQVYQNMVNSEPPEGDYGLDYPPLRLLSMTLWTRHVMYNIPGFRGWPRNWHLAYSPTGDPAELATEDIASPVLWANTLSIAGASLCAFFLVWIWVNRGGRPALDEPRTGWKSWFAPRKQLVPWKITPVLQIKGLVLFAITATAFFYGMSIAENPVPAGPPTVQFSGRPILSHAGGKNIAIITAAISGQGIDAMWHVDWGTTDHYNHQTNSEGVGADEVSATLTNLPEKTTIHYRITASSERGITRTDDATFNSSDALAPMPPGENFGAVWLTLPQYFGIALLFIGMCTALYWLPPEHKGWACGMVAAIFMWLDPSVIVDSHVWPQWDAWVLPPFMLAALLGTLDWWFTAGIVLGVGMMFKGQTMISGSLLMLWPLMAGRFAALARMGIGFITAAGLVLSPWLVLNNQVPDWTVGPLRWICGVMAAAIISGALSLYRGPLWRRGVDVWKELNGELPSPAAPVVATNFQDASLEAPAIEAIAPAAPVPLRPETSIADLVIFIISVFAAVVMITMLVLKRWPGDVNVPSSFAVGLPLLLAVLIPPWILPRRSIGVWLSAILAATMWLSSSLYHGDWAWKTVGFEYGTRKFTRMALGIGSNGNLPQILETRWGWDVHDPVTTFHFPDIAHGLHLVKPGAPIPDWLHNSGLDGSAFTPDIRQFLMWVFFSLVATAAIGLGIQGRRNHPRALASFACVWILMSNVLCQMAGRYQMWGAAMTSILIGISPGLTILHIIVALLAAGIIGAQLLGSDPSRSPLIHDLMTRFGPDDGWILLTIGLIILYIAVAPGKRPPKEELAL